jgi:hypothetical protein
MNAVFGVIKVNGDMHGVPIIPRAERIINQKRLKQIKDSMHDSYHHGLLRLHQSPQEGP